MYCAVHPDAPLSRVIDFVLLYVRLVIHKPLKKMDSFLSISTGKGPYYGLPDGVTSTVISNIPDPKDILDLQSAIAASSYAPGK